MSLTWSFSSERNFRRCQRQFYFREIMACHNPRSCRSCPFLSLCLGRLAETESGAEPALAIQGTLF